MLSCVVGLLSGCGPLDAPPASEVSRSDSRPLAQVGTVRLDLLFVHGVQGCQGSRERAGGALDELEAAVVAALPARVAAYEASHPGTTVVVRTARTNLYTAPGSGSQPSDSPNPLNMDDWEAGDPGCQATRQGEPCTTAYEWRYRLAKEVDRLFPGGTNVVLVGHSTGARAAFEVAANVGAGGVGTQDWGVQGRIAGVVSIQGMIDSLGTSKYNVVGAASFVTTCKNGELILGYGDSCAPGNGWCEYAGNVGAFPAADWVARNKHALMLTSWASCSPSLWTGYSDGSLPFDAQGSGMAVGTAMTPAPGQTWRPAHGIKYGSFCHGTITSAGASGHAQAVSAARERILDWLFAKAPAVAASGGVTTASSVAYNVSTPTYAVGSACAAGRVDEGLQVVGLCKHPGFFDGDDHAIAASELTVTDGPDCTGSFKWTQRHDSGNKHAATFWWKTQSLPEARGVVATLPGE